MSCKVKVRYRKREHICAYSTNELAPIKLHLKTLDVISDKH